MCYQGNVDTVTHRYSSFNDEEKKKYRAERRELLLHHTTVSIALFCPPVSSFCCSMLNAARNGWLCTKRTEKRTSAKSEAAAYIRTFRYSHFFLSLIRGRRILEKLGELGYLTEFDQMSDDQMYAFIKHRLVFQNRLLTERSKFVLVSPSVPRFKSRSLAKYQGRNHRIHGRHQDNATRTRTRPGYST